MFGHELQGPTGRQRRRASFQRIGVKLADERNVAHGVLPLGRAEIKVIDGHRLLKHRRVGALRDRQEDGVDMAHIVTPDHIGAIGQTVGVLCIRRFQQQCRGIDGAA